MKSHAAYTSCEEVGSGRLWYAATTGAVQRAVFGEFAGVGCSKAYTRGPG